MSLKQLLVVCALGLPASARADVPFAQAQTALQGALAPTRSEVLEARASRLQAAAEGLALALPGVVAVQAHVTIPDPAYVPLDQPLPRAQLSLVVTTQGAEPKDVRIRQSLEPILRAAGADLQLFRAKTVHSDAPLETRTSPRETGLKPVLALSLVANVLLATLLIIRIRRRSR